ncbi:RNA ligase [Arthrobacter phage Ottawa]|nr:RNA ligase [Arthrobacter phage Kharcho]WIC89319.1 RNA ligase [Arthrobacter phage Ottawa]
MNRKVTMPIEAAQSFAKGLAESIFVEGFAEGLAAAEAAGLDAVTIEAMPTDAGYDIEVREPTGVIVGWFLPQYTADTLAIPGGEPAADLHVTIGYFGDASAMSADQQRKLIGVTSEVAQRHTHLQGQLRGVGRFSNGEETDPFWVGVSIPGLSEFREDLLSSLAAAGISPQGLGADNYIPHVTVAYLGADEATPPVTVRGVEAYVADVTIAIGGTRHKVSLAEPPTDSEAVQPESYSAYVPDIITKSAEAIEEDRFTLAPWYIPNTLDAHGDWTDPVEIQKALWGYVETDDRSIRLQHNTDIKAGQWVEAVTWPFEVEAPLTKADGTITKHKFPAGTTFLGVKWDPWAWELVKSGDLSGFSIGGTGDMILADLGEVDPR